MVQIGDIRDIFLWVEAVFAFRPFNIILFSTFCGIKLYILKLMLNYGKNAYNRIPFILLGVGLAIYTYSDLVWILSFTTTGVIKTKLVISNFFRFLMNCAWYFLPLQFCSLSLFTRTLIDPDYRISFYSRCVLSVCVIMTFGGFTPYIALIFLQGQSELFSSYFKFFDWFWFRDTHIKELIVHGGGLVLLSFNIASVAIKANNNKDLPYLLRLQLAPFFKIFSFFVIAESLSDFPNISPERFEFLRNNLPVQCLSSGMLTAAIVFYAHRVRQLRFLNIVPYITFNTNRDIRAQLRVAKQALHEALVLYSLHFIAKDFFRDSYGFNSELVHTHYRTLRQRKESTADLADDERVVERFVFEEPALYEAYFIPESVVVYDHILFESFYQKNAPVMKVRRLLEALNAEFFLPLMSGDRFIAYIIVKREKNKEYLFSRTDTESIDLFMIYFAYTITDIGNTRDYMRPEERQRLLGELHVTQQQVVKYHEALKYIVDRSKLLTHGIIIFKNNQFEFMNDAAADLCTVDPNIHKGHQLTIALRAMAQKLSQPMYRRSAENVLVSNKTGESLTLFGSYCEGVGIVIFVSYADIRRMLTPNQHLLTPTDADYLIFLQTTDAGRLINRLIPGDGEQLQQFKLGLLKYALQKRALFLDVPRDDQDRFVSIVHQIGGRTVLHTLNLSEPIQSADDFCILLFGVQNFFDQSRKPDAPLLEKLDKVGTLWIHNIHFLDLKTQKLLSAFLKTGTFKLYRSEQLVSADVRIVCTSDIELSVLFDQGKLEKGLYEELSQLTLVMPSLLEIAQVEFDDMINEVQNTLIAQPDIHSLIGLSDTEKQKLRAARPTTITGLETTVATLIKQRAKKQEISINEAELLYGTQSGDALLIEAAQLGKQALRDKKILKQLLARLGGNHAKIGQLLQVDRSTVYRRCKEFGLITVSESSERASRPH
jgi:transcriptional regulator with GAF, ATPase, and Fis domain